MSQPDGYLAVPAADAPQRGAVLVLHPWWGLNDTIKTFCQRLAGEGFVVFAPDLYHGKVVSTIADADAMSSALGSNYKQAVAEVGEAAAFLKARADVGDKGIALVAFSMGVFYGLYLSVTQPDLVRAVVIFYGTGLDDFSGSKADFLGHFAEADEFEPLPNVEHMEQAIKAAGRPVTFHIYPGTGHWFFEPDRTDAYNAEAASLAWERTLDFLKRS
ncbi:MAG: dienelactone hydrolase family protein, partial [Anaerolinea sp.]|nr:dienelactone hydrolase family protein [Anaerolinea sp.]